MLNFTRVLALKPWLHPEGRGPEVIAKYFNTMALNVCQQLESNQEETIVMK